MERHPVAVLHIHLTEHNIYIFLNYKGYRLINIITLLYSVNVTGLKGKILSQSVFSKSLCNIVFVSILVVS